MQSSPRPSPLSRRGLLAGAAGALAAPTVVRAQGTVLRLGIDPGGAVPAEVLGPHAVALADRVARITGGAVRMDIHPVALLEGSGLGAVQDAQVDAVLGAADAWLGVDIGFGLFAKVPMGFLPGEYEAWVLQGSGQQALAALAASQDVVVLPAGDAGSRPAGWFAHPLAGVTPLAGLGIGADGLGAALLPALGAVPANWQTARDGADAPGPMAAETLSQRFDVAATPALLSPQQAISLVISAGAVTPDQRAVLAYAALAEAEALGAARAVPTARTQPPTPIPPEVLGPLAQTLWQALGDLTAGQGALPYLFDDYMMSLREISAWTAIGEGAFAAARARALEG